MACFYSAPLAWNPTGVDTGKVGKGLRHPGEAKLAQKVERWMFQHSCSFQW